MVEEGVILLEKSPIGLDVTNEVALMSAHVINV